MTIYASPDNYQQPWFQWQERLDLFVLVEDWVFTWAEDGYQWRLKVRKGYPTDKSSVPRALWWLARPDAESEGAALLHDLGYLRRGVWNSDELLVQVGDEWQAAPLSARTWSRQRLDDTYRWHCVLGGLKPWQAGVRYWALRAWPPLWGKF